MFTTWSGRSSIEQQQPTGGTNKPPVAAASSHVATTPTSSYDAALPSTGGAGGVGARSRTNANDLLLPHDAVLSEIYTGTSASEHHRHIASVGPSSLQNLDTTTAARPSANALPAEGSPQSSSSSQRESESAGAIASATTEAIFDGLFPDEPGFPSSSSSSMGAAQRLLWTHLERILELQTDLAGMHMQMERIGVVPDQPATSSGHTQHHQRSDKSSKLRDDRSISMFMDGGGAELDGLAGDDDDDDDENDAGQKKDSTTLAGKNRKKDVDGMGGDGNDNYNDGDENTGTTSDPKQDFASLADSFTGRKKAIDSIMAKLDDLSQEVTCFHALVAPTIDLSSRANTKSNSMGSTATAAAVDARPTSQDVSAKRNPNHPVLSSLVKPGDDHRKKHMVESPASLMIDGLP